MVTGSQCVNKPSQDFACQQETLSNLISLAVVNKNHKGAVVEISKVFDPAHYVACRWVHENGTFYTFI